MELAASRVVSDLQEGLKRKDLHILSRLTDFVSTLRGENPRASLEELQISVKLWKALEPKLGSLCEIAENEMQQWR